MRNRRSWIVHTAVAVFAISGWVVAWKLDRQRKALPKADQVGSQRSRIIDSTRPSRHREAASVTAEITADGRTQQLVDQLQDISGNGVPGVANAAFKRLADKTLLDNNWERRTRNFGLLLEHLRPEDALAMHEEFDRMHREGRPYGDEYRLFATRWGEIDGQAALDFMVNRERPNRGDISNALKGWGQSDPESALAWLAESGDEPFMAHVRGGQGAVLRGWARTDPEAATDWVIARAETLDPAEQQNYLAHSVTEMLRENLYGLGIDGAAAWLASLPEGDVVGNAAASAWGKLSGERLNRLDPGIAAATWTQIADLEWVGVGEFSRFYDLIARDNAGDDQPFYDALLGSGWTEDDLTGQFERWTEQAPEATSRWLVEKNPSAAIRHAAILGMVNYLERTDPEAAEAWRKELESGE